MRKLAALLSSISRDGPIVGYRSYLQYRLGPVFGRIEPMQVTVGRQNIWVRPGTPDLRVALQSLRAEFDILSDLLPPHFEGLIIDAGGYIGTAALKLSKMYPHAIVVTIEASSRNFEMLLRNVAENEKIVPIRAALHPEAGMSFELVDRGTGPWGFSIATSAADTTGIETVTTVTLAEIMARFPGKRAGIMKIDIEGGELALFSKPDPAIEAVEVIFIELHDRIAAGCTDVFKAFSSDRWLLNPGGEKFLSLRRERSSAALVNLSGTITTES